MIYILVFNRDISTDMTSCFCFPHLSQLMGGSPGEGVTVWILALQDREVTIITQTAVDTMFLGWCFIGSSRTSIRVTGHLLGLHAPATDLVRTHFRTFLSVPRSCIVRRLLSPVVTDLLTSKAEIENVSAPTKPKQFFCSSRKKSFHFSFFKWWKGKN